MRLRNEGHAHEVRAQLRLTILLVLGPPGTGNWNRLEQTNSDCTIQPRKPPCKWHRARPVWLGFPTLTGELPKLRFKNTCALLDGVYCYFFRFLPRGRGRKPNSKMVPMAGPELGPRVGAGGPRARGPATGALKKVRKWTAMSLKETGTGNNQNSALRKQSRYILN